jgi:hypothetical protein
LLANHLIVEYAARTAPPPAYLKSSVKARVRVLRDQLSTDDQSLLRMRVDEAKPWSQLAEQSLRDRSQLEASKLGREERRLRKHFERATGRLRKLACADGLFEMCELNGFGELPPANGNTPYGQLAVDYDDCRFDALLDEAAIAVQRHW